MKVIYILLPLYLFTYSAYSIELYVWHDENGVKHISMIPREGFNSDGTVKDQYNPNSFVYQHKLLLEDIQRKSEQHEKESLPEWKEPATPTNTKHIPNGHEWLTWKYSRKVNAIRNMLNHLKSIGDTVLHSPEHWVQEIDYVYKNSPSFTLNASVTEIAALMATEAGHW